MKYLHLIWKNITRKKLRALFTILSVMIAFILFAFLAAIRLAFSLGIDITGEDRLILIHKVSLIQLLPESYEVRLEQLDGVVEAAHATWFGGIYQEPKNFFPQMAVVPEPYLSMYPEIVLTDDEVRGWVEDRAGAIVGRKTAERFGWSVGDRVPLQAPVWRKKDGGNTWEFTIRGIYEGSTKEFDETNFFFHYDYLDEARWTGEGLVGWYMIRIAEPERAIEIAETIDAGFANSQYETKTTTEKAFIQSFAKQIGDVGAILTAVLTAVFFTILLVAGNTMAQAVRERTSELAVLKTLGYSNGAVLGLVLAESITVACVGGGLGLLIGWLWIQAGDPTGGMLAVFHFPTRDLVLGIVMVLVLGVVTGIVPAMRAMRLKIVDGLRRV